MQDGAGELRQSETPEIRPGLSDLGASSMDEDFEMGRMDEDIAADVVTGVGGNGLEHGLGTNTLPVGAEVRGLGGTDAQSLEDEENTMTDEAEEEPVTYGIPYGDIPLDINLKNEEGDLASRFHNALKAWPHAPYDHFVSFSRSSCRPPAPPVLLKRYSDYRVGMHMLRSWGRYEISEPIRPFQTII